VITQFTTYCIFDENGKISSASTIPIHSGFGKGVIVCQDILTKHADLGKKMAICLSFGNSSPA
jgi:hypothetical protein